VDKRADHLLPSPGGALTVAYVVRIYSSKNTFQNDETFERNKKLGGMCEAEGKEAKAKKCKRSAALDCKEAGGEGHG
jgi:hypothetical protein